MILENIVMELAANDTTLDNDWIQSVRNNRRESKRAMNRFQKWRAGLMNQAEEDEYSRAVTAYVEGKRQ